MTIVYTVAILAASGLLFGAVLAFASRVFAVETDPTVEAITEALPGANCGACGYPGCSSYAQAVAAGKAGTGLCIPGGDDTAAKIAEIMGVEPVDIEEKIAFVRCRGKDCQELFVYDGIKECLAAHQLGGGHKACSWACLGFGDCVRVCRFDAISMGPDGLPVVDYAKCTGCGLCAEACPRDVIGMLPDEAQVMIACGSHDKGAVVRKICKDGCIGCGICARNCPQKAITMVDNLAVIDYEKCDACGVCVEKCPTGTIVWKES
ncbi:MAG: RnfABCDGE type electron transport complex subunit B [Firmicutes bacterium]|jgi:electron transport complex protein RnfB|nr:RnfABCDGE type electron transport complex subunit B [Bacillota bacterium]